MKQFFIAAALAFSIFLFAGCESTNKLYDLKNDNLSAPAQNAVRICNTLTWIYNTSSDYQDMSETLDEIGITRQELETMKFSGSYEKPFARKFSMGPSDNDENKVYAAAKKQAQKIAKLMLKKLPPQGGNNEE